MDNIPNSQNNTSPPKKDDFVDPYKEGVPVIPKKPANPLVHKQQHEAPLPVIQKNSNKITQKTTQPESLATKKEAPAPPSNLPTGEAKVPTKQDGRPVTTIPPKPKVETQKQNPNKESGEDGEEEKPTISERLRSSLRTYEDDVASILGRKKVSVSDIRSAEIKKREANAGKPDQTVIQNQKPPKKKRNWNMIFVSLLILLLVLAGGTILYSTLTKQKPKEVIEFEETVVSPQEFFLVDVQTEFPLGRLGQNAFKNAVIEKKGETLASLGEMVNIYFTEEREAGKRLMPFSGFLDNLNINIPGELQRNVNEVFMFGIHVFDGNEPYLVIKTSSYGNAFSGMLSWEKTIENDLKGIFTPTNEEVLATATTSNTILGLKHHFKDKVVENRDSRYIQDKNGKTLLIYSFISTDTIVITTNEDTLSEIIDRVARVRFAR